MSNGDILVDSIKGFLTKPSIKKCTKEFIKEQFKIIKNHATKAETILCDDMINIMSMNCVKQQNKKKIIDDNQKFVTIATKYKGTYDKKPNKDTINIAASEEMMDDGDITWDEEITEDEDTAKDEDIEENVMTDEDIMNFMMDEDSTMGEDIMTNEDNMENKNTVAIATNKNDTNIKMSKDEVEKMLDANIPKYNRYNSNHPMKGVTWHNKRKKYRVTDKKTKTNNYVLKLDDACNIIMCALTPSFVHEKMIKHMFAYGGNNFIVYSENGDPCFDIQHMISVLNVKQTSYENKYAEYSKQIVARHWCKNEYGGYILRELIDEDTMYNLVLSSNSKFSKKFKSDVSKILVALRKSGQLQISNDELSLKKTDYFEQYTALKYMKERPYKYSSGADMDYLRELIARGKDDEIRNHYNKHVLYAMAMLIKNIDDYIIIKIGYSEDLKTRIKTLEKDYNCETIFLAARPISGKREELAFHKKLRDKYPELIFEHYKNNKERKELYKLNPVIMNKCFSCDVTLMQYMFNNNITVTRMEMALTQLKYREQIRVGGLDSWDFNINEEEEEADKIEAEARALRMLKKKAPVQVNRIRI